MFSINTLHIPLEVTLTSKHSETRNSEPVKAVAHDSLSIKNFDVLAFDWSINFQMSFVEHGSARETFV